MSTSSLKPHNPRDEAAAILALYTARVASMDTLGSILDIVGSAVEVLQVPIEDTLFRYEEGTDRMAEAVSPEALQKALLTVREWEAEGLDFRTVFAPDYPCNLHSIHNRPAWLFIEGAWREEMDSRGVAVVGTRGASDRGLSVARKLARELVDARYTVFSGLAAGIDTAAHTGALDAGGRTVAVMGTGILRRYPAANRGLADRIVASGGALLSQFMPDQPPAKWVFPRRNITMSGLAVATVVVEAASTSGAKMQARYALEHGRPVFLVSSLVSQHEWAKKYVEEGHQGIHATEVESTADIVEHLSGNGFDESH